MEKHTGTHKINHYVHRRHLSDLDPSTYLIFQSMTWCSCDANYQFSYMPGQKHFLLLYVLKGECDFRQKNISHTLHEGSIVLTDTSSGSSFLSFSSPGRVVWLCFSGSLAERLINDITAEYGNFYFGISLSSHLNHIYQTASSDSDDHNKDFMLSCLLYQLLGRLSSGSVKENRTGSAIRYIHLHYREDIPTDLLAQLCNMSKYHFIRCFNMEHGVTPVVYINRYRISVSSELLAESDCTISEIAEKSGFQTASYFSKTFRQYTGYSPREYRKLSLHRTDDLIPV